MLVEEQAPVDHPIGPNGPEADQVGEELQLGAAGLEAVRLSHLAVAVPIGRVGELEGDRDRTAGPEEARAIVEQFQRTLLADRRWQESKRTVHW